jgi:hypothetical protein
MLNIGDFSRKLSETLRHAEQGGAVAIEIRSGELHRALGGYPGIDHRMPVCCEAMYKEQRASDTILSQPPKGKGASVVIRYQLPR